MLHPSGRANMNDEVAEEHGLKSATKGHPLDPLVTSWYPPEGPDPIRKELKKKGARPRSSGRKPARIQILKPGVISTAIQVCFELIIISGLILSFLSSVFLFFGK